MVEITRQPLSIGLLGCSLDTGNLGVSALCISTIIGVIARAPNAKITVFDFTPGRRLVDLDLGDRNILIEKQGLASSKRFYRSSNLLQVDIARRLGLGRFQPVLRKLQDLDAVLDLSGGDSFTDLYGAWRENSISAPKELVLELKKKLILMPQTYGPFRKPSSAARAREIILRASLAYSRDANSYGIVQELLGADFDASKQRVGVDVAFSLPQHLPKQEVRDRYHRFADRFDEVIGLNLSGLLINTPNIDAERFGFRTSYTSLVLRTIRSILSNAKAGIVLVPHVITSQQHYEDDSTAIETIYAMLGTEDRSRILIADPLADCMQVKWIIAQSDFFIGTRMHACIAALSSTVPTISIAYSDKTSGVFRTAGLDEFVVDPRDDSCELDLEAMITSIRLHKGNVKARLVNSVDDCQRIWSRQFDEIVSEVVA